MRRAPGGMRVVREVAAVTRTRGLRVGLWGGRRVEGKRQTPGLLMIGGVGAGSNSSVERWGAVSEGARHRVRVGAAEVPAPSERLKVVHGQ